MDGTIHGIHSMFFCSVQKLKMPSCTISLHVYIPSWKLKLKEIMKTNDNHYLH
jgi:hypothetical protein